jgi:hypothetical protein
MAQMPRVGDLEIDQDLTHQRREWRTERVGWIVLLLVLAAALLGLLGRGPMSNAAAGSDLAQMQYQRFARHGAATELEFLLAPSAVHEGQLQLQLDRDYVAGVRTQDVEPEPQTVAVAAGHLTYTFVVESAERPLHVIFRIEPLRMGMLPLAVAVAGQEQLAARQWIYP